MYLSKPNYASIAMNFADVVMGLICSKNKIFVFVYRFCLYVQ